MWELRKDSKMEKIYKKARAKINLSLEVLEKRKDNYHNLISIFQKVNLYDEFWLQKTNTNKIEIKTNIEALNNQENIIYKAYLKLKEKYPQITGVDVTINKKIPMQAGLAGGSTDGASFILAMNQLFSLNMPKDEIEKVGKELGADVVPCLYNQAILAKGIGEIITPINTNFKYYIVIVKPKMSCSTKEMYQKIDQANRKIKLSKTDKIIQALEQNQLKQVANHLYNHFEEVIEEKDLIERIKEELVKQGACGSLLTGSGSCIYGLFEEKEVAKKAYQNLKNKYQTYLCCSYNSKRGMK